MPPKTGHGETARVRRRLAVGLSRRVLSGLIVTSVVRQMNRGHPSPSSRGDEITGLRYRGRDVPDWPWLF